MKVILFVLFLQSGTPGTFGVVFDDYDSCVQMRDTVRQWLPDLIEGKPDAVAAECAAVEAFTRA